MSCPNFALCPYFYVVEKLLRRCQEIVKEVSMMCQGIIKELLMMCQGIVEEFTRSFQGRVKDKLGLSSAKLSSLS